MSEEFTKTTRENVQDSKRVYELPDVKKNPPNLENATLPFVIDELGRIRRIMSRVKKLEGYYKEFVKAHWPMIDDPSGETYYNEDGEEVVKKVPASTFRGEIYGLERGVTWPERVDLAAVREKLGDETPVTRSETISFRSNGTEDLDEFVIDVGNWDD